MTFSFDRFADKFKENNLTKRILTKAFGLRFIINVVGKAGKFNLIPLLLTVGSGLGLLTIAAIVTDCFIFNCSDYKRKFRDAAQLHTVKINNAYENNAYVNENVQ